MKKIKKGLLENYINNLINESFSTDNAIRVSKRLIPRLQLDNVMDIIKKIFNTTSDVYSPEFVQAVFDYQSKYNDIKVKDGILGPVTLNHMKNNYPELRRALDISKPTDKDIDINDFKERIAKIESMGTGGYKAENPNSSAVGKYQLLWNFWGGRIREFANNPELTKDDFLNDPKLQERYMDHYIKTVLIPETKKLVNRHIESHKYKFETLMALLHFKGYSGSVKWIKHKIDLTSNNNKGTEKYLSGFEKS